MIVGMAYWLQKEFKIIDSETRVVLLTKKLVRCIFISIHRVWVDFERILLLF